MTLPPDFWTKPLPGGQVGLFVGLIIGAAAWCYFVLPAYWKAKWPSFKSWYLMVVMAPMMIIGGTVGAIIGTLIAFELGY
jgi:ABC-type xylose transport system permease subunit